GHDRGQLRMDGNEVRLVIEVEAAPSGRGPEVYAVGSLGDRREAVAPGKLTAADSRSRRFRATRSAQPAAGDAGDRGTGIEPERVRRLKRRQRPVQVHGGVP